MPEPTNRRSVVERAGSMGQATARPENVIRRARHVETVPGAGPSWPRGGRRTRRSHSDGGATLPAGRKGMAQASKPRGVRHVEEADQTALLTVQEQWKLRWGR